MSALFLVGDVRERMAQLPDAWFDFVLCSPPFLALRSYLPPDHPDKDREIGSEATPAEFVDVLLALTAEWGRLLAPHGSIAIELGDTYSGSGGAGGDYGEGGLREGQARFDGSASKAYGTGAAPRPARNRWRSPTPVGLARYNDHRGNPAGMRDQTFQGANTRTGGGAGWGLDKSLCGMPQAYMLSLIYGRNVLRAPATAADALRWVDELRAAGLTVDMALDVVWSWVAEEGDPYSPAGRWRVRNLKPWIRSNPPVGALGDKERPATSYVIVATRATDRWFDLDAVRTAHSEPIRTNVNREKLAAPERGNGGDARGHVLHTGNAAGAPPRDWWHHVDAVLDAELAARAGKPTANRRNARGVDARPNTHKSGDDDRTGGNRSTLAIADPDEPTTGAQGVHLRRALERAGVLRTVDALDVSPKGYSGAHYAVWPMELVRLLVDEMCPRRVCVTCGQPSRRITDPFTLTGRNSDEVKRLADEAKAVLGGYFREFVQSTTATRTSTWSDCGHDTWRPGRILDPFVGSGTTLAVATGMGRDATGIDIDTRNAVLAMGRVGMWLDVDWGTPDLTLLTLPAGAPDPAAYAPWVTDQTAERLLAAIAGLWHQGTRRRALTATRRPAGRPIPLAAGQLGMFHDSAPREVPA